MPKHSIQLAGSFTPEQEKTYAHLPFEMPAGAVRLEVAYRYSEQISSDPLISGGNTIDLGVFDERGIDFLKAGFRGWTGSERLKFFITRERATPGYLAGELNPGTWHVLLGLYKIAPGGCQYQVTIQITTGKPRPRRASSARREGDLAGSRPAAPHFPWLRGELHCHTTHSDGKLSPARLVETALRRGMDFLAVTDHNSIAGQQELETFDDPGLILLRGVEATTFKGHFCVWGIPDFVDFRVQAPEDLRAALDFANAKGALTSCNHPKPFGPNWDYPAVSNHACVEVWNGPWSGFNEMALNYWMSLLAEGRQLPAVGGSDFHRPGEGSGRSARRIGTPTNWVRVDGSPSPGGILQAIRSGHVSLSDQPDGPFLELRGGPGLTALEGDELVPERDGSGLFQARCEGGRGCVLSLLDQDGVVWEQKISRSDQSVELRAPLAASLYLRAELRAKDGRLRALTNPIYRGAVSARREGPLSF